MSTEQQAPPEVSPPELVLYKAPQAWNLPSLSPACVQVEVRLLDAAAERVSRRSRPTPSLCAAQCRASRLPAAPIAAEDLSSRGSIGARAPAGPPPAAAAACRPFAACSNATACRPGAPHLQAYLRLAKVRFAVQECAAPSASPTGQLPALDTAADLVGGDAAAAAHLAPPLAEWAAARTMVEYLRHKVGGC